MQLSGNFGTSSEANLVPERLVEDRVCCWSEEPGLLQHLGSLLELLVCRRCWVAFHSKIFAANCSAEATSTANTNWRFARRVEAIALRKP